MRHNYLKNSFLIIALVLFSINGFSQNKRTFWSQSSSQSTTSSDIVFAKAIPQNNAILNLDLEGLTNALSYAPSRGTNTPSSVILDFPNAKGGLQAYRIKEASVMTEDFQALYPNIRSYVGQGVDNPAALIRFSVSPQKGLSSMVLSNEKTIFIEPYTSDLKTYIAFVNSESDPRAGDFECHTESIKQESTISEEEFTALRNADDGQLRTYRLALSATVEYSQYHGGTMANVISAMNTTMTRVNGVYERDLGLTMVMVNNTSIIFLGPNVDSDPFTNNSPGALIDENQTVCDSNIGSANYDIGHNFSTVGSGLAQLNSPCTNSKARGITGAAVPQGDPFDIDYVAHEMGHQFGGNHTQNNSCQRSSVSVEPGSASTIMGYAGICAPNVQNNSDAYFNGDNLQEMWLNISVGNSSNCGQSSATGNVAPIANAGADYSIPKSTAFILKGAATDVNTGDGLTYCWEQSDETPATMPPVSTSTAGPAFRSLTPKTSPDRYMPDFNTVLSGSLASTWEVVPSVGRTMDFLLTVRDNAPSGGNTSSDNTIITVEDVTPFTVSTPPTWAPGSTQTVNWALGQSNVAPINCQTVNVLFSNNNGLTFTTIASAVPNTGSATVTVPNVANSTSARVIVEANDNIFYAVSDVFSINTTQDFSISNTSGDLSACNIDSVTYNLDYVTSNGFSETTTFSATGVPAGATATFVPTSLSTDGSFTLELSNLLAVANGTYTIDVVGTSSSITKSTSVGLIVTDGLCSSTGTTQYQTSVTRVAINTIDNASAKPFGYNDYTAMITNLTRESAYDLTVQVNTDGNFALGTIAWIDWNQNCTFDSNEEYNLGVAQGVTDGATSASPLSIIVPADAVLGQTTMRVSTQYNAYPTACATNFDGEVEDYTINVEAALSVDKFSISNLSIYPNPNNGEFTIKFNNTQSSAISLEVFDIRGRSIMNNTYNVNGEFNQTVNLGNVQSGLYLLNVNDGQRTITKKIVVE